jgi:hypothetical protein
LPEIEEEKSPAEVKVKKKKKAFLAADPNILAKNLLNP